MTKSKKDKKAGPVAKLARRTTGLVVRAVDALEAVVAAATPVPAATSTATAPVPAPSSVVAPKASAPVATPAPAHLALAPDAPMATPAPEHTAPSADAPVLLPAEARPAAPAPGPPLAIVVDPPKPLDDGARALAAIERYAMQHNLQAVDMPGRETLVEALLRGMAQHGPQFADAHARYALDEQMRIHLRLLGVRAGISAAGI